MNSTQIIKELQKSDLYAECTCGEEFRIKQSILFDGLGKFPDSAGQKRQELLMEIKSRLEDLKKRKLSADVGAEKKAIEIGIGKIMEKILPAHRDFPIPISDCRPLFEPIDMIIFNGCTQNKVDSITFFEIKTGNARLNEHQKAVKEAVENQRIGFKMI